MQHSGIGGGGFMLVRGPDGTFESIGEIIDIMDNFTLLKPSLDFRETAPAAAYKDMYKHDPYASVFSGLASGVPGDVRGLEYLHQKYGVRA
jgi:gamma-glutamyltranspeptidase/glutathione hydrolase